MMDGERTFETLYQTYAREVYGYLYARSGMEPRTAEDLTQETFLAVYRGMGRFRGLCSERTWVFRIAAHKLNDYYRGRYRRAVELGLEEDPEPDDDGEPMERLLERAAERELVARCMGGLPERYRTTLSLRYFSGKSVREIAALAGVSVKSAEAALTRAKAAFARSYLQLEASSDEA